MVKVHMVRSENFMQTCIIPYTHAGFLRSKDALRRLDNIQLSWVLAGHLTRGNYRLAPFDLRPRLMANGVPGRPGLFRRRSDPLPHIRPLVMSYVTR